MRLRSSLLPILLIGCILGWGVLARTNSETWWWVALLDSVPPQLLLPLPLWLLWKSARRRAWVDVALSVLASFLLVLQMGFVLPRISTGTDQNGIPLTILNLNADFASTDPNKLATIAKREDVDVLVLQEALNRDRQGADFEAALRKSFPGWSLRRHDELVTLSRLPVFGSAVQTFPNSPHAVLAVQVGAHGQAVKIVNTHLPTLAILPSQSDTELRRTLGQRISRRLSVRRDFLTVTQALLNQNAGPILLVGDLNAPPRRELHARLRAQGWTDTFQQGGAGFGFTHHARLPHSRIDYVWMRGASAASVRVLSDVLSDHRAVLASLRLPVP